MATMSHVAETGDNVACVDGTIGDNVAGFGDNIAVLATMSPFLVTLSLLWTGL